MVVCCGLVGRGACIQSLLVSVLLLVLVFPYLSSREFSGLTPQFDVYGKRQTAKIKLLPSVFSSLYSRIKIFVFAVNSKRHFSIFV